MEAEAGAEAEAEAEAHALRGTGVASTSTPPVVVASSAQHLLHLVTELTTSLPHARNAAGLKQVQP